MRTPLVCLLGVLALRGLTEPQAEGVEVLEVGGGRTASMKKKKGKRSWLNLCADYIKTEERHFAEACKEQFLSVARKWDIEGKTTTIGTDSARNMVAAIRLTRYEHMNCVAHMVQRSVTVSLADSGFVNALAKARKVVGHFKHSPANAAELQAQQVSLGKKQEPLIQDNQEHKLVLPIAAEWDKLQRLETLLEPCRYVTELLGGEAYVSCSVVLPSLCHLRLKMEACDEDPAYVVRFKTKFKEDLASRQEQLNNAWLQIATVLDPRFKDLKCLPKTDREKVWTTLEGMLQQERSPEQTPVLQDTAECVSAGQVFNGFGLSREALTVLLDLLRSATVQTPVFLFCLASGVSYRVVSRVLDMPRSTVLRVTEEVLAIHQEIHLLKTPEHLEAGLGSKLMLFF
ncbi:uncharacterized protein LOC131537288 [Onychostoma macrolepis]|uniref:uncharacterized protein LOC131537288 n=1 Tax=Onychostoma macrolepis TaxID=369639 RepID=UPI00272B4C1F|nr:uncharacterized protein LOC131537288 [Onychostoma macrolepis]